MMATKESAPDELMGSTRPKTTETHPCSYWEFLSGRAPLREQHRPETTWTRRRAKSGVFWMASLVGVCARCARDWTSVMPRRGNESGERVEEDVADDSETQNGSDGENDDGEEGEESLGVVEIKMCSVKIPNFKSRRPSGHESSLRLGNTQIAPLNPPASLCSTSLHRQTTKPGLATVLNNTRCVHNQVTRLRYGLQCVSDSPFIVVSSFAFSSENVSRVSHLFSTQGRGCVPRTRVLLCAVGGRCLPPLLFCTFCTSRSRLCVKMGGFSSSWAVWPQPFSKHLVRCTQAQQPHLSERHPWVSNCY